MALVKTSALVATISGSIGAANFANTRNGLVVRPRAQKPNPNTAIQQTRRAAYTETVRAWALRTTGEKLSWNNNAKFYPQTNRLGQPRLLSGFALFVKNTMRAFTSGHSGGAFPPVPLVYSPLQSVTLDYKTGNYLNMSAWITGPAAPTRIDCYGLRGYNRQLAATPRNLKYFAHVVPSAYPTATNIRTAFEAAFGAPTNGETIWLKLIPTNLNSFLTPPWYATTVVHA